MPRDFCHATRGAPVVLSWAEHGLCVCVRVRIDDAHLQAQVGVGIVFQADAFGALAVKSLAVGGAHEVLCIPPLLGFAALAPQAVLILFYCYPGPADKSREIMIGDILHEIDGVHVFQKPLCTCPFSCWPLFQIC